MSPMNASDLDYAEAWSPEPGEIIAGTVVEITTRDGGYGDYPIVTLETDEGARAVNGRMVR